MRWNARPFKRSRNVYPHAPCFLFCEHPKTLRHDPNFAVLNLALLTIMMQRSLLSSSSSSCTEQSLAESEKLDGLQKDRSAVRRAKRKENDINREGAFSSATELVRCMERRTENSRSSVDVRQEDARMRYVTLPHALLPDFTQHFTLVRMSILVFVFLSVFILAYAFGVFAKFCALKVSSISIAASATAPSKAGLRYLILACVFTVFAKPRELNIAIIAVALSPVTSNISSFLTLR